MIFWVLISIFLIIVSIVLFSVEQKVSTFLDLVKGYLPKAQSATVTVDHTMRSYERVAGKVEKQLDKFDGLVDVATTVFQQRARELLPSQDKSMLEVVVQSGVHVISTVIALVRTSDNVARMAIVSSFVVSSPIFSSIRNLSNIIMQDLLPLLARLSRAWRPEKHVVSAEDDFDPKGIFAQENSDGIFSNALFALGKIFGQIFGKDVTFTKEDRTAIVDARNTFSLIKDFGSALNWICDFSWKAFSLVYNKITGQPFYTPENEQLLNEAFEWVKKCEKSLTDDSIPEIQKFPQVATMVLELRKEGEEIGARLLANKYTHANFSYFYNVLARMNGLCNVANAHRRLANCRVPPVVVHLTGKPNNGKTKLIDYLVTTLQKISGCPMDRNNKYVKPSNSDYWDGYTHQFSVILDDFLQHQDGDVLAKKMIELLEMGNTNPMALNMAFEKGTSFFDSSLIVLTSNDPSLAHIKKIQNLDAIRRRMDFIFHVEIDDKFKSLNPSGLTQITVPKGSHPTDLYRIALLNSMDGSTVLKNMTFGDMIQMVGQEIVNRQKVNPSVFFDEIVDQDAVAVRAKYNILAQAGDSIPNMENYSPSSVPKMENETWYSYFKRKWSGAHAAHDQVIFKELFGIKDNHINSMQLGVMDKFFLRMSGIKELDAYKIDAAAVMEALIDGYQGMDFQRMWKLRNKIVIDCVVIVPDSNKRLQKVLSILNVSYITVSKTPIFSIDKNLPCYCRQCGALFGEVSGFLAHNCITPTMYVPKLYCVVCTCGKVSQSRKVHDVHAQMFGGGGQSEAHRVKFSDLTNVFMKANGLELDGSSGYSGDKAAEVFNKALTFCLNQIYIGHEEYSVVGSELPVVCRSFIDPGHTIKNFFKLMKMEAEYIKNTESSLMHSLKLLSGQLLVGVSAYLAVAAVIFGAQKVIQIMYPKSEEEETDVEMEAEEGQYYKPPKTRVVTKTRARVGLAERKKMILEKKGMLAQSYDVNLETLVGNIGKKNIYKIKLMNDTRGFASTCQITFLKSRLGMTSGHTFAGLKTNDKITLFIPETGESCGSDEVDYVFLPDLDTVFIEFPKTFKERKDITGHFLKDEDLRTHYRNEIVRVFKDQNDNIAWYCAPSARSVIDACYTLEKDDGRNEVLKVYSALAVEGMLNSRGACGSLYLVMDPSTQRKIIGAHVAGSAQGRTYGAIITQEILKQVEESLAKAQGLNEEYAWDDQKGYEVYQNWMRKNDVLTAKVGNQEISSVSPYEDPDWLSRGPQITYDCDELNHYSGDDWYNCLEEYIDENATMNKVAMEEDLGPDYENLTYIATVKPEWNHRLPGKTQITKSLIHGCITDPVTKPAMLKKKGGISPLEKVMGKLDVKRPRLSWEAHCVVHQVAWHLAFEESSLIDAPLRTLTLEEAVATGSENYPIAPINTKTSAGWPHNNMCRMAGVPLKGKNLFIENGKLTIAGAYFCNRFYEALSQDLMWPVVFTVNLKDERRPIEKVVQGKTRGIQCGPFEFNILLRMLWGDELGFSQKNWRSLESKVGINPHSTEWAELFDDFQNFEQDQMHIPGDFEMYDGSAKEEIKLEIYRAFNYHMYKDDNSQNKLNYILRERIVRYLLSPVYLKGRDLYQARGSNPSGQGLTTWDNCRMNSVLDRSVFAILTMRACLNWTPALYPAKVKTANFGDDNQHLPKRDVRSYYNLHTVSDCMLEHFHIVYTDFKKRKDFPDFYHITDLEFLKRGFRKTGVFVFAPLDWSVIEEMVNWISKGQDQVEATRTNCEVSIREAFHWGKEKFEEWKEKINKALVEKRIEPIYLNYDDLLNDYANGKFEEKIGALPLTAQGKLSKLNPEDLPYRKRFTRCPFSFDPENNMKINRVPVRDFKVLGVRMVEEDASSEDVELQAVIYCKGKKKDLPIIIDRKNGMPEMKMLMECEYTGVNGELKTRYVTTSACRRIKTQTGAITVPVRDTSKDEKGKDEMKAQGGSNENVQKEKPQRRLLNPYLGTPAAERDHLAKIAVLRYWKRNPEVAPKPLPAWTKDYEMHAQGSEEKMETGEDGDREIKDATTNEIVQLTAFSDTIGRVEARTHKRTDEIDPVDPYPDQGLKPVLERIYNHTFVWSANQSAGTNIYTFQSPYDHVSAHVNIQDKLARFAFFRAGTRFSIRPNSTRFHFGKLLIAWVPHAPTFFHPQTPATEELFVISNYPHVIVSANVPEAVEFTIPYITPYEWMSVADVNKTTAQYKGFFGTMKVYVLNQLGMSSGSSIPDVNVSVMVNFTDIQVAGPTDATTSPFMFAQGLDEPIKEQERESKDGVISGALNTISNISAFMTSVPYVGKIASFVSPLASASSKVAKYFGYDRPTSVESNAPRSLNLVDRMALGVGLDESRKIALDPQNAVSTNCGVFGKNEDEMLFRNYVTKPTLLDQAKILSSDIAGQNVFYLPVTPCSARHVQLGGTSPTTTYTYIGDNRCSFVGSLFKYWRGSMKYKFQFVCSSYTSARVRIAWCPLWSQRQAVVTSSAGDVISKVVDVSGDTNLEFSIPYLAQPSALRTAPSNIFTSGDLTDVQLDQFCNGCICVSVVNPIAYTDDATNAYIDINVWLAGGEDLRFYAPVAQNEYNVFDPAPAMVAQGLEEPLADNNMWDAFDKTFEPLLPAVTFVKSGVFVGEEIDSFRTYLHRYTYMYKNVNNNTYIDMYDIRTPRQNLNDRSWLATIRLAFLFERGSQRFKLIGTNNLNNDHYYLWASLRDDSTGFPGTEGENLNGGWYIGTTPVLSTMSGFGVEVQSSSTRGAIEFEVPYYSRYPMFYVTTALDPNELRQETYTPVVAITVDSASEPVQKVTGQFFRACGDDYSLGFSRVPPPRFLVYQLSGNQLIKKDTLLLNENSKTPSGHSVRQKGEKKTDALGHGKEESDFGLIRRWSVL